MDIGSEPGEPGSFFLWASRWCRAFERATVSSEYARDMANDFGIRGAVRRAGVAAIVSCSAVVAGAMSDTKAEPPDAVVEVGEAGKASPRAVADYQALCSAWTKRRTVGWDGSKVVAAAAVSRNDLRAIAFERLERGEGTESELLFAMDVIAARWDGAAVAALDRAMENAALPRRIRGSVEGALDDMLGNEYLDPDLAVERPALAGDPPVEERIATLRERMKRRPPLIDGQHLVLLEKLFRRGEAFLAECAEPEADEHCLENSELLLYGYEWLDFGGGEREQAVLLAEHVRRLRGMPRGQDDGRYDRVVGGLQRTAMWWMQEYMGPVEIMKSDVKDRDEIDAVLDRFLAWWDGAKDRPPIEWRMEHLAERGYRVAKTEDGRVIAAELLRAIRAGTPGEARGAADVLRDLGLDCGAAPLPRQWSPDPPTPHAAREVVADALVRGMVSARAAELMIEKGWPGWSDEGGRWELKPGS